MVRQVPSAGKGFRALISASSALWNKALRHPQQLWIRRVFFQVHLWCGVLLALYVVAIGISGSILVFKDELMPRPHVAPVAFHARDCTPHTLLHAMASASAAHPELVPSLASCPTEGNPLYAIALHPRGVSARALTVYVHPLTGQVLGQVDENASWIGFVESFHVDLLMKRNGRSWNGIGASSLLLLVLSGLVLWWPGIRHWRRAFKVDLRRTWKRMNWDLHSAVAIWTLGFTLIWAVTGIYFAWEAPFERMINAVSPITTASYPAAEMNRIAARPVSVSTQTFDPKMVLDDAVRRSPGAALEGIFFGAEPNAVFTVYMARERVGDYASTDFLYFDQQTNEWLYTWHRGVNHTAGDWMLWLFVPLHFGTSWGLAGKIAWCAFGLALPVLATTGLLMYWNRWLGKALKRTASRAS